MTTTAIDDTLAALPGEEGDWGPGIPGNATLDPDPTDAAPGGRPVIAVTLLAAHPGNVRRDLAVDAELIASVRELGILVPLRVTPDGDGYRVIEGHRRLAAAIEAGLPEVPCDTAASRAGDDASQYLDMYPANHHRRPSPRWRKPTRCSPPPAQAHQRPASARPPAWTRTPSTPPWPPDG